MSCSFGVLLKCSLMYRTQYSHQYVYLQDMMAMIYKTNLNWQRQCALLQRLPVALEYLRGGKESPTASQRELIQSQVVWTTPTAFLHGLITTNTTMYTSYSDSHTPHLKHAYVINKKSASFSCTYLVSVLLQSLLQLQRQLQKPVLYLQNSTAVKFATIIRICLLFW